MPSGRVAINLIGKRFGRLTVLGRSEKKGKQISWECRCDCGEKKTIVGQSLRSGLTTSCGCRHREIAARHATKHEHSASRIYKIYHGMKKRCFNKNSRMYRFYGAKGVTIDKRWETFEAFYNDMSPTYRDGLTIDRINPAGPYSPENCRWLTLSDQQRNKRSLILREYNGKKYTITELAKTLKISRTTLSAGFRKGLTVSEIVLTRTNGKTRTRKHQHRLGKTRHINRDSVHRD